MKVILTKDITNIGKKGEVKKIADGYGRNFLIPKKMAVLATQLEIAKAEEQQKIEAQKSEEELQCFQEMASQLDGLEIEIAEKAGEDNKFFGAINVSKIASKLKNLGFEVDKKCVKLEEPIKELGEYEVRLELPHNLEAFIKIIAVEE